MDQTKEADQRGGSRPRKAVRADCLSPAQRPAGTHLLTSAAAAPTAALRPGPRSRPPHHAPAFSPPGLGLPASAQRQLPRGRVRGRPAEPQVRKLSRRPPPGAAGGSPSSPGRCGDWATAAAPGRGPGLERRPSAICPACRTPTCSGVRIRAATSPAGAPGRPQPGSVHSRRWPRRRMQVRGDGKRQEPNPAESARAALAAATPRAWTPLPGAQRPARSAPAGSHWAARGRRRPGPKA